MAKILTTDKEIERALVQAHRLPEEPAATAVRYIKDLDVFVMGLTMGDPVVLDRKKLQGLENATPAQLQNLEITLEGRGLHWPDLDADLFVPALLEGIYGNRKWMQKIGRKGGTARTRAKAKAARANGRKGGRPKKATTA